MSKSVNWEQVPSDPCLSDLGYRPLELDITRSSADGGHYVIIPHDEDYLREEAFIVADDESVVDLVDCL
jgi:hypothetical protein